MQTQSIAMPQVDIRRQQQQQQQLPTQQQHERQQEEKFVAQAARANGTAAAKSLLAGNINRSLLVGNNNRSLLAGINGQSPCTCQITGCEQHIPWELNVGFESRRTNIENRGPETSSVYIRSTGAQMTSQVLESQH